MKKNLYIFGCSGIAKSIVDSVLRNPPDLVGQIFFVDSDKDKAGKSFYQDYPVLHLTDLNPKDTAGHYGIAAYFKPQDIYERKLAFKQVLADYQLKRLTVIDPSASISSSVDVGNGVYIAPNVVVDADAKIGDDSIILFNSVISRDVAVGDNVFISACVVLKGSIDVGQSTFISAGCLVTKDIIGRAFINAGVVVNSVVEPDTIVGNKANTLTINLPQDATAAQKKLRFFHP